MHKAAQHRHTRRVGKYNSHLPYGQGDCGKNALTPWYIDGRQHGAQGQHTGKDKPDVVKKRDVKQRFRLAFALEYVDQLGEHQRQERSGAAGGQVPAVLGDGHEGAEGCKGDKAAAEQDFCRKAVRKHAVARLSRAFFQNVLLTRVHAKGRGGQAVCHKVDKQNLDGQQHHR